MTYAEKYRIEWTDRKGWHDYRISIYEMGYTGPVLHRRLQKGGGAQLIKDASNGINRISLQFAVMCYTDWEFIEPFTPNLLKQKVVLSIDTADKFTGYLQPNQHNEPFRDPPYAVSLTAVNGLGLLENIDYTPAGLISPYTIIKNCLDLTGISLNVRLFSSLSEDNMLGTIHPLREMKVTDEQYAESNCLEVLESVVQNFNLQIQQHNNEWYVYDLADIESASVLVDGTTETETAATSLIQQLGKVDASDCWVAGALSQALNESVKGIDFDFDSKVVTNLVVNPNMSEVSDNDKINDWAKSAAFDTYVLQSKNETYYGLKQTYTTGATEYYYQNLPSFTADTDQSFIFSYKVCEPSGLPLGGYPFTSRVQLCLIGDVSLYYLQSDGTWSLTEDFIEYEIPDALYWDISASSFGENSLMVSNLPVDGHLQLRLYRGELTSQGVTDWCYTLYREINISIVDADENLYPKYTNVLQEENDNILAGSNLSLTFNHSDLPDTYTNHNYIYQGGIDINGDASEYWGGIPLMQEVANRQLHLEWYSSHVLSGAIRGENVNLMSLISHNYRSKRTYYLASGEHNLVTAAISGTFKEWSHGNEVFEAVEGLFCLVGANYLVNCVGAWAEVIDADTGQIRFDATNGIFDKSDTDYWHASVTSNLSYNATNPRDWLLSEFTQLNMATYGTEETQRRLFFREYIGIKSSVLPILVYATERTAEQSKRIHKALRNPQYITEGYVPIKEDTEVITESAITHINVPIAITEDSENITDNNENITQ